MGDPRRLAAWLALPYARLELPGWGRLLRTLKVLGPGADDRWRGAPTLPLRGKWHGYEMRLDLENWSERLSFFLGRYYDLPTQLALRALLRPGDRVVDVGANIGMISLLAARLVGEGGRVEAFEPNPRCVKRLEAVLRGNGVRQVGVHPVALADDADQAVLTVLDAHSGTGTLGDVSEAAQSAATRRYRVEVRRGDDILARGGPDPIAVKIDVEGLEVRVLRGLAKTLGSCRPAVLAETIPEHLARAGDSVGGLCALMRSHGYRGHQLLARRAGLRFRLALPPIGPIEEAPGEARRLEASDTLWLHPESPAYARLEPWLHA